MGFDKPMLIVFGKKVAACLLVIFLLYFIGHTLFKGSDKQAERSVSVVSNLQSAEQDYLLSLSSLFIVDGSDPAISYNIDQVLAYIDSSRKEFQNNLGRSKNPNDSKLAELQKILSEEATLTDQFKAEYKQLSKLLQYQPPLDTSNLSADPNGAKASIQTTVDALVSQQKQPVLTDSTRQQIDSFMACHKKTAELIGQNNLGAAKENSDLCTKLYRKVRSNAVVDLFETKNSSALADLNSRLSKLIKP